FIWLWHGADGLADLSYDRDQRLSFGVPYLGRDSGFGGIGRRPVFDNAADGLAARGMGSHQGQCAAKGSAVLARLYAAGDVEERVFLSALLNDDLGHIQRLDGDSATKTDRRRLRVQQVYSLWQPHRSESDRDAQSGIEWFGAPLLWLDLRSIWPVRHNGNG